MNCVSNRFSNGWDFRKRNGSNEYSPNLLPGGPARARRSGPRSHNQAHGPFRQTHAMIATVFQLYRRLGRPIRLKYGYYDCGSETLYTIHDAGIGSCMMVTLHNLADLFNGGIRPAHVSFSKTMLAFKDGDRHEDIYPRLFSASPRTFDLPSQPGREAKLPRPDGGKRYSEFPYALYGPLIKRYFQPSASVEETLCGWLEKYAIDLDKCATVCIRGTDKFLEVRPIDSSIYIRRVERVLEQGQIKRVLIQTDQEEIAQVFLKYFGGVCFCVEELPRTSGGMAMHLTPLIEGRRTQFARDILAIILLMSRSRYVITHTGNLGAWIALFRGHTDSMYQMIPGEEFL